MAGTRLPLACVRFLIARSMPTANAEDPRRSEGTQRRASSRPFRCYLLIGSAPRRSPSACAEKLLRYSSLILALLLHVSSLFRSRLLPKQNFFLCCRGSRQTTQTQMMAQMIPHAFWPANKLGFRIQCEKGGRESVTEAAHSKAFGCTDFH